METKTYPGTERAVKTFESRGLSDPARVEQIKEIAAALWYEIDGINIAPGNSEAGRYVALAKTELEAAVMWAVKAVSRT